MLTALVATSLFRGVVTLIWDACVPTSQKRAEGKAALPVPWVALPAATRLMVYPSFPTPAAIPPP